MNIVIKIAWGLLVVAVILGIASIVNRILNKKNKYFEIMTVVISICGVAISVLGLTNISDSIKQSSEIFSVDLSVRKNNEANWLPSIFADVGEEVEFQAHYKNNGDPTDNTMFRLVLPSNIQLDTDYVILYNSTNPDGLVETGDVVKDGINIGGYDTYGDAYIRFKGIVIDNNLIEGNNELLTWAQFGVRSTTLQSAAAVNVIKR